MKNSKHHRAQPRFKCEVPVVIFKNRFSRVLMLNFSEGGFYFESSAPLDVGDYIVVRTDGSSMPDPLKFGTRKQRLAEVLWCNEKEINGSRLYGCGARYM